ncbi:MAG: hypothetical protein Q9166_007119 [cf. Caloplaca sp. 2 TL-2023]
MPELRRHHHHDALFSLVPKNEKAKEVSCHPHNHHLAWVFNNGGNGIPQTLGLEIEFIHSQGWSGPSVELFMALKDGSLRSLLHQREPSFAEKMTNRYFPEILRALDFLAFNDVIHRDVKPENILYSAVQPDTGEYHFYLDDFGLCNNANSAITRVGTELSMAPEVHAGGQQQTSKVDVWSLFVTTMWSLDIDDFRTRCNDIGFLGGVRDVVVRAASTDDRMKSIGGMARIDPDERASAAQMINKLFKGEGLTTPRKQVQPLPNWAKVDTKTNLQKITMDLDRD